MKNKRLISVFSAKKMIDSLKKFKNTSEYIDFRDAENRVLAANIFSKKYTKFDNSAVMVLGLIINQ